MQDLSFMNDKIKKCEEDILAIKSSMEVIARHISVLEEKKTSFFERMKPSFLRKKNALEEVQLISKNNFKNFTLND